MLLGCIADRPRGNARGVQQVLEMQCQLLTNMLMEQSGTHRRKCGNAGEDGEEAGCYEVCATEDDKYDGETPGGIGDISLYVAALFLQ